MENGSIEGDLSSDIDHEDGSQHNNINISDVIEVIQTTDPTFDAAVQQCDSEMFSGGGPLPGPSQLPTAHPAGPSSHPDSSHSHSHSRRTARVKIIEQPASKALRFRYECEGRSAGSIPGVRSTPENRTYPTIEIVGYKGRAVVVVSCVTKDHPHKPHPHNLVGKDGCKKGVCTVEINSDSMCVSFSNLGIQCVKKKDIDEALRIREEIRVDPYKTGFAHRSQPTSIDLNAVRLCFQVFLEGGERGRFTYPLPPVVSDIIFDKKAMSDLVICKLSHCSASVAGGKEVILLCEKVAKEDISVRFYEEVDGQLVWEGLGDFQHANVHKQVAIAFRTPRYKTLDVEQPFKVFIQLRRPSDGATSEPYPFELLPLDSDPIALKRKRQRFGGEHVNLLMNLQAPVPDIASALIAQQPICKMYGMSPEHTIKIEPRDQTPSPYGGQQVPHFSNVCMNMQNSPSPQHLPTPSPPLDYQTTGSWIPSMTAGPSTHVPLQSMPGTSHQPMPGTLHQPMPGTLHQTMPGILHQPMSSTSHQTMSGTSHQPMPGTSHQPMSGTLQQPLQLGTDHSTLSSLLDMDSHQLTQLNSAELAGLSSLLEGTYPHSNRQDSRMNIIDQENMTDSFTRLTTNINEFELNQNNFNRPQ